MNKILLSLLFIAGDCIAHPGHGAQVMHAHGWDWAQIALASGVAIGTLAVAAAVVYWRSK